TNSGNGRLFTLGGILCATLFKIWPGILRRLGETNFFGAWARWVFSFFAPTVPFRGGRRVLWPVYLYLLFLRSLQAFTSSRITLSSCFRLWAFWSLRDAPS